MQSMGFDEGGKHYFYLEEVLFLMHRGVLLLLLSAQQQLYSLSVQECYALTSANADLPLQCCLAYNHVKSKGFIVRRMPTDESSASLLSLPGVLPQAFDVYQPHARFSKKAKSKPAFRLVVCRYEDSPPLADLHQHMQRHYCEPRTDEPATGCTVCVVGADGSVLAFDVHGSGAAALHPGQQHNSMTSSALPRATA
jgi:hypothetical protein